MNQFDVLDLEVIMLVNRHRAEVEFESFTRCLTAISAKRKRGDRRVQKMPRLRRKS